MERAPVPMARPAGPTHTRAAPSGLLPTLVRVPRTAAARDAAPTDSRAIPMTLRAVAEGIGEIPMLPGAAPTAPIGTPMRAVDARMKPSAIDHVLRATARRAIAVRVARGRLPAMSSRPPADASRPP